MAIATTIERLTGLHWKGQGPAVLAGLGHGAIHWIAATFYLLLPFITEDFGLTYVEAGMLVAVLHVSSMVANFGSGPVTDVTGRRILIQVLSLVVGAAAMLAMGVVETVIWLAVLVALIGISNNFWHPAAISFLSVNYPRNRGYALSIHALGANLGDAVAPLVGGALLVWATWQQTALSGAVPATAIAIAIAVFFAGNGRGGAEAGAAGMDLGDYMTGLWRMVRDRTVLSLCLMAGFRTMTQNGLFVFLPLYLAHELDVGPFLVGLSLSILQAGGIVAAPIAGAWSDRVGRRPVVLAGLTVTTVVLCGLTLVGDGVFFVCGVALLGFALFSVRPVVHSWLMDLTPAHLGGSATSVMFGFQSTLSILAPVVGGLIADAWGLSAVFYMLAGTVLIANLLVFLLPKETPTLDSAAGSG
jgi:MFS family permease